MPLTSQQRCVHCGRECGSVHVGGVANVPDDAGNQLPVCHVHEDGRPDCYHLITVYHHQLKDCEECRS
jgi:hypothetical protein